MIETTLQQLGLTDKEVAIYLALLPLGSAPASALGARTGINRSTSQYICQQLTKKGIVKALEKNHTYIYTPESPDKLLYLLDLEKQKLTEKESQVHRIIGDLKAMINPQATLPKVRYFEGVTGIIEMLNDVLETNTKIYGVLKLEEDIHPEIANYLNTTYTPKRQKLGNPAWMIFNDNPATQEYRKNDRKVNRVSLLLPQSDFPFETCYHIYGRKVAFYSYKKTDMTGVIIENTNIHDTQFSIFKAAWNFARQEKLNAQYKKILL